jgi:8-oxo-dGDP phosphatase
MVSWRWGRRALGPGQPLAGMVDAEHVVFVRRDAEQAGEPVGMDELERAEWVLLAPVPQLVAERQLWHGGSLVALLRLLAMGRATGAH